ncbi:hypothetical protein L218DRAFT_1006021 [Marasmius fiardii PR-910]|nr:hypothetical protein L218DRAFT_1006021 [Marasmius fiardii PR-910]
MGFVHATPIVPVNETATVLVKRYEAASSPIGVIVGGVTGAMAIIVVVVFWCSKKERKTRRETLRKTRPSRSELLEIPSEYLPTPFNISPDPLGSPGNSVIRSTPLPVTSIDAARPTVQPAATIIDSRKISGVKPAGRESSDSEPLLSSTTPRVIQTHGNFQFERVRDQPRSSSTREDSTFLSDDLHTRLHAVSTADLVRVLHTRLQDGAWRGEMPPAYPESHVGEESCGLERVSSFVQLHCHKMGLA